MNFGSSVTGPKRRLAAMSSCLVFVAVGIAAFAASSDRRGRSSAGTCALGLCAAFSSIVGLNPNGASAYDGGASSYSGDPSEWYTRYPAYPEQCSTPSQMASRSIPPLTDDPKAGWGSGSRLRHVTAVFRHGARTAHPGKKCWDGYRESVETGIWDCNLTSVDGVSPATMGFADMNGDNDDAGGRSGLLLVEKRYDAFSDKEGQRRTNYLGGTCGQDQLLARGALQGRTLGSFFRDAYTYTSSGDSDAEEGDAADDGADSRLHLLRRDLDLAAVGEVYVRSDNFQRTVMTAHSVLTGLFGPESAEYASRHGGKPPIIPLHVADQDRDVFLPKNEKSKCHRLHDIWKRSDSWPPRVRLRASQESEVLNTFLKNEIPRLYDDPNECLMSIMCADLGIPPEIDDFGRSDDEVKRMGTKLARIHRHYGRDLFSRVVDNDVRDWVTHWQYNDGEYAKVNMGPVWAEIMSNVRPHAEGSSSAEREQPPVGSGESSPSGSAPPKMALFSAHDSTITQLLVSLGSEVWDGQWTPYAGAMVIEIHELTSRDESIDRSLYSSNYAFRLLYNGRVLTSKVGGCPPDAHLCDARVLLDRVGPFATFHPDCSRLPEEEGKMMEEEGEGRRRGLLRDGGETVDDEDGDCDRGDSRRRALSDDWRQEDVTSSERQFPRNDRAPSFVAIASASAGAILGSLVTILVMTLASRRR